MQNAIKLAPDPRLSFTGGLMAIDATHTTIFCNRPHTCPGCRAARTVFINRGGRTLCYECDGKELA